MISVWDGASRQGVGWAPVSEDVPACPWHEDQRGCVWLAGGQSNMVSDLYEETESSLTMDRWPVTKPKPKYKLNVDTYTLTPRLKTLLFNSISPLCHLSLAHLELYVIPLILPLSLPPSLPTVWLF